MWSRRAASHAGWAAPIPAHARLTAASRRAAAFAAQPVAPRALLVAVQWLVLAAFALAGARHNEWLFFQGGDQMWHYTTAELLTEGVLAPTHVGYLWPALLSPFALVFGELFLAALPAVVLFQAAVLLPAAVLAVHALVSRIGGPLLGGAAGVVWIALPHAAVPLFDERYHERYVDQFVPQALGLTAMSDYPSMVALLVAAVFAFRAIDHGARVDALAAGAAAGAAIAIKPANLLFLPPALLAIALVRRASLPLAFSAGVAPALLVLLIWKQLGLGYVPAFAQSEMRLAASLDLAAALPGPLDRYLDLDWGNLATIDDELREYFWSVRLLEWLPIAGALAVARRSLPGAVLLAGWLAAFLVAKGTSPVASVEANTFFRLLMPAFPAFFVLAAAVPLLLPRVGDSLAERGRTAAADGRRAAAAVAVTLLCVTVAPVAAMAATEPLEDERAVEIRTQSLVAPVVDLEVHARAVPGGVELTWDPPDASADVFYRVLRARPGRDLSCPPPTGEPQLCRLTMPTVATVREPRYVTDDPASEDWVYRVGVAANWADDPLEGDILALSEAVRPGR